MAIENAQQMIPKIQAFFASQPIKKAWLFGSCSRGEERPDSDVDILVEYEDSDNISLFAISRMISSLKKILNKNVDLVEEGCILPFAENSVYKDRILIYEGKS
jgi:predicted nucleotidyltransferase